MKESKIIVRMSRSTGIYNKRNKYEIFLNNDSKVELDFINNKHTFITSSGKNSIVFKNENTTIVKEVNIKNGQDLTFIINKNTSYKLGIGIMIGIAITGLTIQLLIDRKAMLPLMFIPFIPLLFVKKENFLKSFEITTTK
jgi:hypothetical protein